SGLAMHRGHDVFEALTTGARPARRVECDDAGTGCGDRESGDTRRGDEDADAADLHEPDQWHVEGSADERNVVETLSPNRGGATDHGRLSDPRHRPGIAHRLAGVRLAGDDEPAP